MGIEKTIKKVNVTDTEKRYQPCKHYVFILSVQWSDGTNLPVYRKYSDFYDLHLDLIEQFPAAAGHGGDRILPYLTTKKVFGRNEIKKVAVERKMMLDEYCRTLVGLPSNILQDDTVLEFFEARETDINPSIEATKRKDSVGLISSLSLMIPKFLQKSKKTESKTRGESMADEMCVSGPVDFDSYYVIADYKATGKGEMELFAGQEVEVIEKNDNGWWLVSSGMEHGWAPSSFLEPLNINQEIDEPEPLYNGETYVTLAEYTAELDDEISFAKGVIVEVLHKLLDGWWIVSYNGNVGHAPATLLVECKNPLVLSANIPKPKKKPRLPTQRRCTIKNARSKWTDKKGGLPQKDLTLYRRMSDRVSIRKNKDLKQGRPPAPLPSGGRQKALPPLPISGSSTFTEDNGELYVNDNDTELLERASQSHLLEKFVAPYRDNNGNDDIDYEDVTTNKSNGNRAIINVPVEEEEYINVQTTVSPNSRAVPTTPPTPKPRNITAPVNKNIKPLLPTKNINRPKQYIENNNITLNRLNPERVPTPLAMVANPKVLPKPTVKLKPTKETLTAPVSKETISRTPSPRAPRIVNNNNDVNVQGKGILAQRLAQFNKT